LNKIWKRKCMLKFEFKKNFMSKIIKLNFLFILSKAQWFGGEHLGASPWCLGFKPWWMCVKVCNVYIHWYIMYKYDIWNMYDANEISSRLFC